MNDTRGQWVLKHNQLQGVHSHTTLKLSTGLSLSLRLFLPPLSTSLRIIPPSLPIHMHLIHTENYTLSNINFTDTHLQCIFSENTLSMYYCFPNLGTLMKSATHTPYNQKTLQSTADLYCDTKETLGSVFPPQALFSVAKGIFIHPRVCQYFLHMGLAVLTTFPLECGVHRSIKYSLILYQKQQQLKQYRISG